MKQTFFLTIVLALVFALGNVSNSEAGCCGPGWGCHRGGYGYGYRYLPPPPPVYYYHMPHRHFYGRPYYGGYRGRRW